MSLPHFKFDLSKASNGRYVVISLGNKPVHIVTNICGLYEALGYTNEHRCSGLMPDEFLWFEYRKDGRRKPEICMHSRVIEYLREQSPTFTEKYSDQLEQWAGCCPEKMALKTPDCAHCWLAPTGAGETPTV